MIRFPEDRRRREVSEDEIAAMIDPIKLVQLFLSQETKFGITKADSICEESRFLNFVSRGYRKLLMETIKFLTHFLVVMLLLFFGAIVFAHIEDPEREQSIATQKENNTVNVLKGTLNYSHNIALLHTDKGLFWIGVDLKYNINLSEHIKKSVLKDVKSLITMEERKEAKAEYQKRIHDRTYIFMKWFYFVTVATTTIGYGDIFPKTDAGKIFYCGFSIIGITMMLSLLKSCGAIWTGINKRFYRLINRHLWCRHKKLLSEELLSVISITLIFLCYLLLGIWHSKMAETTDWSLLDVIYYWLVTFTTVGFGDVVLPMDVEMDHLYHLVIYRIFGLSILAGIVDSITDYVKWRKKVLGRGTLKFSQRQREILERAVASLCKKDLFLPLQKKACADTVESIS